MHWQGWFTLGVVALVFAVMVRGLRTPDVTLLAGAAALFAASYGFATPIGYQTHLMVYGPGGYRFSDFLKIGLPLDVLMGVLAALLIPRIWPLEWAP